MVPFSTCLKARSVQCWHQLLKQIMLHKGFRISNILENNNPDVIRNYLRDICETRWLLAQRCPGIVLPSTITNKVQPKLLLQWFHQQSYLSSEHDVSRSCLLLPAFNLSWQQCQSPHCPVSVDSLHAITVVRSIWGFYMKGCMQLHTHCGITKCLIDWWQWNHSLDWY